jgi:hypothetical protein
MSLTVQIRLMERADKIVRAACDSVNSLLRIVARNGWSKHHFAMLQIPELTAQLRTLGVQSGGMLLVHMSYRAVRPVEDEPAGVISALRAAVGNSGTIVMPSWGDDDDARFDPATTPASASLGVVAELFRQLPDVKRSAHPLPSRRRLIPRDG